MFIGPIEVRMVSFRRGSVLQMRLKRIPTRSCTRDKTGTDVPPHSKLQLLDFSLFETLTIPDIRQKLISSGASEAQIAICEEFMMDQHKFYVNYMQQEAEKRLQLIKHIRLLEVHAASLNPKRAMTAGRQETLGAANLCERRTESSFPRVSCFCRGRRSMQEFVFSLCF